jgi:hypothetical protein
LGAGYAIVVEVGVWQPITPASEPKAKNNATALEENRLVIRDLKWSKGLFDRGETTATTLSPRSLVSQAGWVIQ